MTIYAIAQPGHLLVKIGHARDLRSRLQGIRTMSPVPLEVLGNWPGDRKQELELHHRFAERRQHGEWFDFTDADPVALISTALGRAAEAFVDHGPHQRRRAGRRSTGGRPSDRLLTYPEDHPDRAQLFINARGQVVSETPCTGCAGIDVPHGAGSVHKVIMSREQYDMAISLETSSPNIPDWAWGDSLPGPLEARAASPLRSLAGHGTDHGM